MREEKEILMEEIAGRMGNSPFAFLIDYGRLTVAQFEQLRARLRDCGAEVHAYKNTLVRRAASRMDYDVAEVAPYLAGQTAVVTGTDDIAPAVKALLGFTKETKLGEIRGGLLEGRVLDEAGVKALQDMLSKPEAQAKLLGTLLAPARKLLATMNEPAAQMVRVLVAKKDKEEKDGD
jgi:large subunit ribosomal protein L10